MQAARSALQRLASSQVPSKTGKQVRKMSGAVSHEEVGAQSFTQYVESIGNQD